MSAATHQITVNVRVRWWLVWYLRGVYVTCKLTGREPDWSAVERRIRQAVVVT